MRKETFRDRVAIITGASAGIGQALALQLAKKGARVALAARRADRLERVAEECRQSGGEVMVVPTDVSDEMQCRALIAQTAAEFGRIDLLINNAGFAMIGKLDELPDLRLFKALINVNYFGAVHCTYYALPHLIQSRGRIVMMSSLGGKVSIPYNSPYCASKFAMQGFSDALRMELRRDGVSVTVICPFWVASEFHSAQIDKNGVPRGEARGRDYYTSRTMSAERCAEITLRAAARRRREVIMAPGNLVIWLKLLAPRLLDWMVIKIFLEPAARRARAASRQVDEK